MSESAPIILTAQMGKSDQKWANALRNQYFPRERNFIDAHITLFHHLPPGHLPEIKTRIKTIVREYTRPDTMLTQLMLLGRGVAYRIESPDLLAMRGELARDFHGLLIPQDQASPRLHITVQNKVEPKEAKALYEELSADFEPRPLGIIGLSAFYYRGGPWEAIGDFPFRG